MTVAKRKPVAPKPAPRPAARLDLFKEALAPELVYEGGEVNNPKDPGGRTNRGVTQRVYNGWRDRNHLPPRDVYDISDNEVEGLFRYQYWDAIKGDQLPRGLGFVVFDGAVNSGVSQSVKWLQRALGVKADGILGSVTLLAAKSALDVDVLIAKVLDRREIFLRALKTFKHFGKGWISRIQQVEKLGQAWATGSVGPTPTRFDGADAKALIDDAKSAPVRAPGDLATGGGVTGSGLSAIVDGAKDQLMPFAGSGWIDNLLLWLVIAGAVLAVAGFGYRWWAAHKKKQLADALDQVPA